MKKKAPEFVFFLELEKLSGKWWERFIISFQKERGFGVRDFGGVGYGV
jgi:hypothetical protein